MCVANALAEAQGAAMDAVCAGNSGNDGVDQAEAAVTVAVPIETDIRFHLIEHSPDVTNHSPGAVRRRVTNRVADGDALRTLLDRGAEQSTQRLWLRAGRVFGDVHDGKLVLTSEPHGVARVVDHLLDRPALGVLPDRTGSDEGGHFNGDAHTLRDFNDGSDIELECASLTERL